MRPVSPRFSSAMAWRTRTWSSTPKPSSCSSPGDSTGSAPVPTKVPSRNSDTAPGSSGEPLGRIELGIEVGLGVELRHGADGEHRLDAVLLQKDALGLAGRGTVRRPGTANTAWNGAAATLAPCSTDVDGRRLGRALVGQLRRADGFLAHAEPSQFAIGCRRGRRRCRRHLAHLRLEIDGDGVDDRRGGVGGRPRRRQQQRDVVPALAGALDDIGAARKLEQRRGGLRAGRKARVVARRPAGIAHLVAHGQIGIERRGGDDEHLDLGLLVARRRQRAELLLQILDAPVELALLHLGVERQALRVGHAARR